MAYHSGAIGPDNRHPITGIRLNPVEIERIALSFDDAVTAWIMRIQRVKYSIIAQHLGTNAHRLGEVFRQEHHPDAMNEAMRLLASR